MSSVDWDVLLFIWVTIGYLLIFWFKMGQIDLSLCVYEKAGYVKTAWLVTILTIFLWPVATYISDAAGLYILRDRERLKK